MLTRFSLPCDCMVVWRFADGVTHDLRLHNPQVFASALASWQLGVWNAPSNRGLRAKKMNFYDREHYYQVPDNPIGTVSTTPGSIC